MENKTIFLIALALLLVVGAVFVSAEYLGEQRDANAEGTINPFAEGEGCGCGCSGQCGGRCGVSGCGCKAD